MVGHRARAILAEISIRTLFVRSFVVFILLMPIGILSSEDPGVRKILSESVLTRHFFRASTSVSSLLWDSGRSKGNSSQAPSPVIYDKRDYSAILGWRKFDEQRLREYWPIIEQAASLNAVEADLIRAVIVVESRVNPSAVSHKGAQGLMQLMPATASELNVSNPFDPKQNILGGASYLKQMLREFDSRWDLAIAAYNAGPGRVSAAGRVPNIKETKNYVRDVLKAYALFKGLDPLIFVSETLNPVEDDDPFKWSIPGA